MSETPRLLDFVRSVSRQRALSRKTENAYINHIRRFQNFHAERDLAQVGTEGVSDFLNHLKLTEKLGAATCNQALSALAFLYRDVFGQPNLLLLKTVERPKPAAKTPVVFTPEEARQVLSKMRGDSFLVAALMYGSGLRLSEAVALRVGEIDFERRTITVRDARTGRRDRTTVLPEAIIPALRRHLVNVRYLHEDDCLLGVKNQPADEALEWRRQFVFPSHNLSVGAQRHHLAESTVQKAVAEAILKANIIKQACCQTFRYSFAARLFERNYDIRRIQTLLGHKNLKTTAVYMQFTSRAVSAVRSPLDN